MHQNLIKMKRAISFLILIIIGSRVCPQSVSPHSLDYYIEQAQNNSPLIGDYNNQQTVSKYEQQRLKVFYTQSKLELDGNLLFVPIVSKDNGNVRFELTPQNTTSYYGYDQGISSGSLQAGLLLTKPIFANSSLKVAQQQEFVTTDINKNNIKLQKHDLQRLVTDQYILCLLDRQKIAFTDSLLQILDKQGKIVHKLSQASIMKQSDCKLIEIEMDDYTELRKSCEQSYHTHLLDLNILCGIKDTTTVMLDDIKLYPKINNSENSPFIEKYKLDSLNLITHQGISEIQYKPRINLFVDGGLRASQYSLSTFNHFGMSAGVTFAWTIFDGRQRKITRNQTKTELNTVSLYRENFILQNDLRKNQYLSELKGDDERGSILQKQLELYDQVLSDYNKEIQNGQLSIIDYITVLKNKTQATENYYLLKANRLLLINAFNYYNW